MRTCTLNVINADKSAVVTSHHILSDPTHLERPGTMTLVTKSKPASTLLACWEVQDEAAPLFAPHVDALKLIVTFPALEVFGQLYSLITDDAQRLITYPTYIFRGFVFNMASPKYFRIKHFMDTAAKCLSSAPDVAITIVVGPSDVLLDRFPASITAFAQALGSAVDTMTPSRSCTLMYRPRPTHDEWETRLAEVHTGLQGSGATHLGTQYRIVNLPLLDSWTEEWGEGVEFLLLRLRIELERPERRGVENVAQ
jgi:hypothetical protein